MLAQKIEARGREIVYRTRGHTREPITRLVSPSDLGELIKPFVFLDLAAFDGRLAPTPLDYGWHPHSGIATVTVMLEGAVRFASAGPISRPRGTPWRGWPCTRACCGRRR
jgi:redox-sensitive bicupin YhaK (pirin superfamily)